MPIQPTNDLYDPSFEHDACGVGMICRIDGVREHRVVADAVQILQNLEHRGACGCDPETGDGAGILLQIPHRFLKDEAKLAGFALPEPGEYALGVLFLPAVDPDVPGILRTRAEATFRRSGMDVLGWRRVPTASTCIGPAARSREPEVWQIFVARPEGVFDTPAFERRLFVARRRLENAVWNLGLPGSDEFHIPSLSSRTVVYKGMLTVEQLTGYFPDLWDTRVESAVALVHSRFSTNTLPRWPLAHPFRYLCHNGEINTLRGNVNWMRAREAMFETDLFGDDLADVLPILTPGGSDSQQLDNALELLCLSGRSLPHAMMMLIPEAWEHHETMDEDLMAFYRYHACLMEPWDGPAAVLFFDGRYAGAMLDRNGLRPSRYTVTHDGYLILGSEAGTLDTHPSNVKELGRLKPGRMLLVDLDAGVLLDDAAFKTELARSRPYAEWVTRKTVALEDLEPVEASSSRAGAAVPAPESGDLTTWQRLFGYTRETVEELLAPMARDGKEAMGSMGRDIPLAVLSQQARPVFDYFTQLFAQVTNPPLDAIRESLVTSLISNLGGCRNIFEETADHADVVRLERPVLTSNELGRIRATRDTRTVPILFAPSGGGRGLGDALADICREVEKAVDEGVRIVILSDRSAGRGQAPIPSLLAMGAVHQHLVAVGKRLACSIVVESGEPREVHHLCLLVGFGASAVQPWLALETVRSLANAGELGAADGRMAEKRYMKALSDGLLKVMSKMGISTVHSYRGAQLFEAVGIGPEVMETCFRGTVSRIGGVSFEEIAADYAVFHDGAFPRSYAAADTSARTGAIHPAGETSGRSGANLPVGGHYSWRRTGEHHSLRPLPVARLQHAVRTNDAATFAEYSRAMDHPEGAISTLRGLLDLDADAVVPIPLDEVEPWTEIVRRFKTGAMSYGSISGEAHRTLAEAMNRIGGSSNTGEGGEEPDRYDRSSPERSRIKQVASGRFGVTIEYLSSADEIQIKMAQGAKPGEGGQLPGSKVYPHIARTRHSTPWVGLISPPPHHDIYSIEDLAQLIFDLRNANPQARISVKLVAEAGVGTVAAGVAKAGADVVLISGHDGGTGASPKTSIMHAGLPWEIGLAETHQTLLRNGLRRRIRVECDGQLRTGRDVAIAAMLGADEFGFATAPLIAMGCVMMRKCHLNTCPVGIATQDPELRKLFRGTADHVVNYFHFVAEELRVIMATLGIRRVGDLVGRSDLLKPLAGRPGAKARTVDIKRLLVRPDVPASLAMYDRPAVRNELFGALDYRLVATAIPALERGESVELEVRLKNVHRTVGTLLSHTITTRRSASDITGGHITVRARGTAGQSFFAFGAPGITAILTGSANDYFGKGLSGSRLVVQPPANAGFRAHEQIIIGNVALYGATSGEVFLRGRAGERFAVRNSGATAVVEGVGDHGCEYMTGGTVVVLGPTGRNFAAGMSGGVAYVLDGTQDFRNGRCDRSMVDVESLTEPEDLELVRGLVQSHLELTGSDVAAWVLGRWEDAVDQFVKVIPIEYRAALERIRAEAAASGGLAA